MIIYKILTQDQWAQIQLDGTFLGAPIDIKDGYVHFSSREQVLETANMHFKGQNGLMLLAVDTDQLSDALKFEPSRGGQLFPHLYGRLSLSHVAVALPFTADIDSGFNFPEGMPQ